MKDSIRMQDIVVMLLAVMNDPECADSERLLAAEGLEEVVRNNLAEDCHTISRQVQNFLHSSLSDPDMAVRAALCALKWDLV